jgi:hypothetical protein
MIVEQAETQLRVLVPIEEEEECKGNREYRLQVKSVFLRQHFVDGWIG